MCEEGQDSRCGRDGHRARARTRALPRWSEVRVSSWPGMLPSRHGVSMCSPVPVGVGLTRREGGGGEGEGDQIDYDESHEQLRFALR